MHWPAEPCEVMRPFTDKARYLGCYADRMRPRIEAGKRRLPVPDVDVQAELKSWFEPLLELAAISGPG